MGEEKEVGSGWVFVLGGVGWIGESGGLVDLRIGIAVREVR